jgi:hypothetical protein
MPGDKPLVRVRTLQPPRHGFFVYLLAANYPLSGRAREEYLAVFAELDQKLRVLHGGAPETLVQMPQLHHEAASEFLSKHGADWMPEIGVSVWPHKPPPALWTQKEFQEFVPGEIPRPPISMVFRLNGPAEKRKNVAALMGGRGAVIHIWLQGSPQDFYRREEEYFREFITDPLHLAFPFFFPLLDFEALRSIPDELAGRLLGPVKVYARESMEDKGLLILSADTLASIFSGLGWEADELL